MAVDEYLVACCVCGKQAIKGKDRRREWIDSNDSRYAETVSDYFKRIPEGSVSHTYCPTCHTKLKEDLRKEDRRQEPRGTEEDRK